MRSSGGKRENKIVNACIIKITEVGCGFAELEN
jgi:hypothetical protein